MLASSPGLYPGFSAAVVSATSSASFTFDQTPVTPNKMSFQSAWEADSLAPMWLAVARTPFEKFADPYVTIFTPGQAKLNLRPCIASLHTKVKRCPVGAGGDDKDGQCGRVFIPNDYHGPSPSPRQKQHVSYGCTQFVARTCTSVHTIALELRAPMRLRATSA